MASQSKTIFASTVALCALALICAGVSFTGGLPEPAATYIGQNISRTGHFLFLTLGITWLLFSPLAPNETRLTRFLTVLFAALAYLLLVEGCKHFIYLPRPGQSAIRVEATRGSGFPSGHTVPAFEIAYLLALVSPRLAIPALTMAVLIGYSRAEVTAHYPYQVVLSGLIGVGASILIGAWRQKRIQHNAEKHLHLP